MTKKGTPARNIIPSLIIQMERVEAEIADLKLQVRDLNEDRAQIMQKIRDYGHAPNQLIMDFDGPVVPTEDLFPDESDV